MSFDLKQHLLRQMAFSLATFGPGERREGVIDHIRKELVEVEEGHGEAAEWVDVVILALDGLTRRLSWACGVDSVHSPNYGRVDPERVAEMVCNLLKGKQTRNESRRWPDWRTADATKAIEHKRDRPIAVFTADGCRPRQDHDDDVFPPSKPGPTSPPKETV